MKKICKDCNIEKEIELFVKNKASKNGYKNTCKECQKEYYNNFKIKNPNYVKEYAKEYAKKNYENNKELKKEYQKKYRENNKEKIKKYREINSDILKQKTKDYLKREDVKKRIKNYQKEYVKNKRNKDFLYKLKGNVRTLISQSINKKEIGIKTVNIIGCSFEEFKIYLESKFENWMNWENYGNPNDGKFELNKTWDIDHIIPLDSAKTEEDIIRLNHYTNLQPLCSYTNRYIKRNR